MVSCGGAIRKGQTLLGEAGGAYPPYLIPKYDKTDGLAYPTMVAKAHFYSDLTDNQAAPLVAMLKPQSIASCEEPIVFGASDLTISVYYVLCANDQALPVFVQERACQGIPALRRKLTWASGHFPFLTEPETFATDMVETIGSEIARSCFLGLFCLREGGNTM
ncbi:uncharacterized protein JN550_000224 [Neoarthrinium moseri]|uniref:uncharacterized protein n=1 Tax=Neoarthrinium moseri TaxID=1658444 RepID=UPI001FDE6B46|nr:uncharacterized protein JN550_000224 [Neoarthrinium moseri]KAI1878042.1 hypothetical protein JN550_000224 [Neoarthrinium moseri]